MALYRATLMPYRALFRPTACFKGVLAIRMQNPVDLIARVDEVKTRFAVRNTRKRGSDFGIEVHQLAAKKRSGIGGADAPAEKNLDAERARVRSRREPIRDLIDERALKVPAERIYADT